MTAPRTTPGRADGPAPGGPFTRLAAAARRLLRRGRDRWGWLDHLVHAGGHFNRVQADLLASGVTYYVFLALFPVLLLVAAVAGLVLRGNPLLEEQLVSGIRDAVPGSTGDDLAAQAEAAIDSATTFGVVGLLGALFLGLRAMDRIRVGMDVVWRGQPDPPAFLADRVKDVAGLLGFGVAGALSVGLTTGATSASAWLLDLLGLADAPGVGVVTAAVAIVLALAGDTLVFLWLLRGVPDNPFGWRRLLPGAVFGAVGFELLKVAGNIYLTIISGNVTAQTFGGIVGLIVWLNLVFQFAFYTAAWTATIPAVERERIAAGHVRPRVSA
ncbi:YihY/virulence factor BrkB family protein, partial [Modestobacter roseus]|uniref:YihY/virulence factor BrkB family protein n=1 Tax=Modestobacter roseus TaxID=1181884 RepID=UPI0034DFEF67